MFVIFKKTNRVQNFKKLIPVFHFVIFKLFYLYGFMDKPHKCFGRCVGISVKVTNNPIIFTNIVFKIKKKFRLAWYHRVMVLWKPLNDKLCWKIYDELLFPFNVYRKLLSHSAIPWVLLRSNRTFWKGKFKAFLTFYS